MSRKAKVLTDGHVALCAQELAERLAVRHSDPAALRAVIESDPELAAKIVKGYPDPSKENGLDTYERHWFFDLWTEKVLGLSHWPTLGEHAEPHSKNFLTLVHEKIGDKTLEVVDDPASAAA